MNHKKNDTEQRSPLAINARRNGFEQAAYQKTKYLQSSLQTCRLKEITQ